MSVVSCSTPSSPKRLNIKMENSGGTHRDRKHGREVDSSAVVVKACVSGCV